MYLHLVESSSVLCVCAYFDDDVLQLCSVSVRLNSTIWFKATLVHICPIVFVPLYKTRHILIANENYKIEKLIKVRC